MASKSGLSSSGSTAKTRTFLQKMQTGSALTGLEAIAQRGVDALASATPVDSGLTASSWSYIIEKKGNLTFVSWLNTNQVNGTHVAILLQFGHGTGTGGYVQGYDYINPAIRPIMDELANEIWKKVVAS